MNEINKLNEWKRPLQGCDLIRALVLSTLFFPSKILVWFLYETMCNCYIYLLIFTDEEGQVSAV